MQALTGSFRSAFTSEQITALHGAPVLTVGKGLELLNPDLSVRADIGAGRLRDATLNWKLSADIHGTCQLKIAGALAWGIDLVRVYSTLSDGRIKARWNRGVYCLSTPTNSVEASVPVYDVQGQNRLALLKRQVGRDYTITAGTAYTAAIKQAFIDAGLEGVLIDGFASDRTLPKTKTYPLVPVRDSTSSSADSSTPTTWLQVVNDLLTAINYRGVWCDEDGYYRCERYLAPAQRPSEYTFTADTGLRLLGPKRQRTQDVWAIPNRWIFIAANPPDGVTPSLSNGLVYIRDNLNEDTLSQLPPPQGRGLVWPATYSYDVANAATLKALGDRRVRQDRDAPTSYSVTTSPFPGAGHADIYTYVDAKAGGTRKVQATSWSAPLGASQMSWTWEEVTA